MKPQHDSDVGDVGALAVLQRETRTKDGGGEKEKEPISLVISWSYQIALDCIPPDVQHVR